MTQRVLFVTGMYPTPERPHWGSFVASQADSLRRAGVQVDVVYPHRGPAAWRYLYGAAQVFARTLGRRYDVVHAHFGLWGWAARAQLTTPVAMSFCGDDLLGRPDGRGGKTWRSRVVVLAGKVLAHCVDAVIVKSDEMARQLPGVASHVIPNGVDCERFQPAEQSVARRALGLDPRATYVIFVGNPREVRKRWDLAAEAARLAAERVPGGLELIPVYDLPSSTVVQYMNAADALLLASLWEGSPNVVKEAMACSLPVVSVAVGDVPELIGRTEGCYVAGPDARDLGEKLALAVSPRRRTTGRADIAHLEVGAVAQRIIATYHEAASRHHTAGAAVRTPAQEARR